MRLRPARPLLFLPLTRFGVVDSDWRYILLAVIVAYMVPAITGLTLWRIPLEMVTAPMAVIMGAAASCLLHKSRPPHWLEHQAVYLFRRARALSHRRQASLRRTLPGVDFIPLTHTDK